MNELTKQLESILTIDGKGRPSKARALLALIRAEFPDDPSMVAGELVLALEEIAQRKFI